MSVLQHIVRGCKTLPYCGEHPGTVWLFFFIFAGVLGGFRGGFWAGLIGGGAMLFCFGPLYLWGAYSRSREEEKFSQKNVDNSGKI